MANTPMYQTGPSDDGLALLVGASNALGGIFAETIESQKAQKNLTGFADVLEKQGLIGDAAIYRQMAAAETPNYIQAAKSGQATKRDLSGPFEHALRQLNESADRETRLEVARENSSGLQETKAGYNADDEIDTADLSMISQQLNDIGNQRTTLENRLAIAEEKGNVALVNSLEEQRKQLDAKENELRGEASRIQGGRRQRKNATFTGAEGDGRVPGTGSILKAQADLPPLPTDEVDAVGSQLPVFTPEGGPNDAGILSKEALRAAPAPKATPENQAMADAFAGNSVTEKPDALVPKADPVIPDMVPSEKTAVPKEEKSNEELAREGKLDYTKNLGLPSDASPRTVRARTNFLNSKQQAFTQNGGVYDEGIDKAQTPEQLKTALNEALKTKRKATGLTSPEEAKQTGDAMLAAMGPDAKGFVAVIDRKGEWNYDVNIVKRSVANVTKTGNVWLVGGKVFTADENGSMVRTDPNTGETTPLTAMDADNKDKRLTQAQFESMVLKYDENTLAQALSITVEEARAMKAKVVGSGPKFEKAIDKGATPLKTTPKGVLEQFLNQ